MEAEARVRLVAAIRLHGLVIREVAERDRNLDGEDVLPYPLQEPLDECKDVLLRDEAHLDVELGEFRLAIRAQVLVAEAPRYLEVAVAPSYHEELLEYLGGLRKRVEFSRMDP